MLGAQTITRQRAALAADEYGNQVAGWSSPDEIDVEGCSVQPADGASTSYMDRGAAITTLYTVWAPIDADIVDTDHITFAGTSYAIEGAVQRWQFGSPLDHLVINLKAVNG